MGCRSARTDNPFLNKPGDWIRKNFPILFKKKPGAARHQRVGEEEFNRRWGTTGTVIATSGENPLLVEGILKMEAQAYFTWLAWRVEGDHLEAQDELLKGRK